jgi:hypothetical protein
MYTVTVAMSLVAIHSMYKHMVVMGGLELTVTVFQNGIASDPLFGVSLHISEIDTFPIT